MHVVLFNVYKCIYVHNCNWIELLLLPNILIVVFSSASDEAVFVSVFLFVCCFVYWWDYPNVYE